MIVEIKIERFDCGMAYGDPVMQSDPEGEYVRFDDMLAGFRGIMAMLTEANAKREREAFDAGHADGFCEASDDF
jgi:hypothetical protein